MAEGHTKLLVIFHFKKIFPFEKTHFVVKKSLRCLVCGAKRCYAHKCYFPKTAQVLSAQNKYPTVQNRRKNSPAVLGWNFISAFFSAKSKHTYERCCVRGWVQSRGCWPAIIAAILFIVPLTKPPSGFNISTQQEQHMANWAGLLPSAQLNVGKNETVCVRILFVVCVLGLRGQLSH